MNVKYIKPEAFSDYKKPYMFIGTPKCSFKCCIEAGLPISVCQNSEWAKLPVENTDNQTIIKQYLSNPITSAIVFGGMEPMDTFDDMVEFIKEFRQQSLDDIVIYTGYLPGEILEKILVLQRFPNIIVKFGRYIPNREPRYDEVLGITLISDNQFAERIS